MTALALGTMTETQKEEGKEPGHMDQKSLFCVVEKPTVSSHDHFEGGLLCHRKAS